MGLSWVRTAAAASIAFMIVAPLTGSEASLAPPFPPRGQSAWVGKPVSWRDLAGQVVLLDVWTFG